MADDSCITWLLASSMHSSTAVSECCCPDSSKPANAFPSSMYICTGIPVLWAWPCRFYGPSTLHAASRTMCDAAYSAIAEADSTDLHVLTGMQHDRTIAGDHLKEGIFILLLGRRVSGGPVDDLDTDWGPAGRLQHIPCKVLVCKVPPTPPVWVLCADAASHVWTALVPAQQLTPQR